MTAAIALDMLEKRLGEFRLGPLTLDIPRGSIYALVGPNGAGKTTTLDLLMGITQADGGRIEMLGFDMRTDDVAIKQRTAYVNPDLNYQPWRTVGRAIDFIRGFYPDWDTARCERLMTQFGLARGDQIRTLSFGQRTKLGLLMALSRDPHILLLDEPTLGLDVESRLALFHELLAFMQREDRTIVISSHQMSDLERFADHLAIVQGGGLRIAGRMDDLVERYRQMDVVVDAAGETSILQSFKVLKRDGNRWRILVDRTQARASLADVPGVEIVAETPMTLEELFVAVVEKTP